MYAEQKTKTIKPETRKKGKITFLQDNWGAQMATKEESVKNTKTILLGGNPLKTMINISK